MSDRQTRRNCASKCRARYPFFSNWRKFREDCLQYCAIVNPATEILPADFPDPDLVGGAPVPIVLPGQIDEVIDGVLNGNDNPNNDNGNNDGNNNNGNNDDGAISPLVLVGAVFFLLLFIVLIYLVVKK